MIIQHSYPTVISLNLGAKGIKLIPREELMLPNNAPTELGRILWSSYQRALVQADLVLLPSDITDRNGKQVFTFQSNAPDRKAERNEAVLAAFFLASK